jgi:hypothetical protein
VTVSVVISSVVPLSSPDDFLKGKWEFCGVKLM